MKARNRILEQLRENMCNYSREMDRCQDCRNNQQLAQYVSAKLDFASQANIHMRYAGFLPAYARRAIKKHGLTFIPTTKAEWLSKNRLLGLDSWLPKSEDSSR